MASKLERQVDVFAKGLDTICLFQHVAWPRRLRQGGLPKLAFIIRENPIVQALFAKSCVSCKRPTETNETQRAGAQGVHLS